MKKYLNVFCASVLWLNFFNVTHANQNPNPSNTIYKLPILIDKGYIILDKEEVQNSLDKSSKKLPYNFLYNPLLKEKLFMQSNKEESSIDIEKIKDLVEGAKNILCSVNAGGSYEIWLEAGLSGGVVVNFSGQSGIKAIINCKPSPEK